MYPTRLLCLASSLSRMSLLPPTTLAALSSLPQSHIEAIYRPYLARKDTGADWVDALELDTVSALAESRKEKIKLLVLYGSLRER